MTRSVLWRAVIATGVTTLVAPAFGDGFYFGFGYGDGPRYYRPCRAYYRSAAVCYDAPVYYSAPRYYDDMVVVRRAPRVVYYDSPRVVYRGYGDCDWRVYVRSGRYYGGRYYYPAHRYSYGRGVSVRVYR